jgi:hypothetical protein
LELDDRAAASGKSIHDGCCKRCFCSLLIMVFSKFFLEEMRLLWRSAAVVVVLVDDDDVVADTTVLYRAPCRRRRRSAVCEKIILLLYVPVAMEKAAAQVGVQLMRPYIIKHNMVIINMQVFRFFILTFCCSVIRRKTHGKRRCEHAKKAVWLAKVTPSVQSMSVVRSLYAIRLAAWFMMMPPKKFNWGGDQLVMHVRSVFEETCWRHLEHSRKIQAYHHPLQVPSQVWRMLLSCIFVLSYLFHKEKELWWASRHN